MLKSFRTDIDNLKKKHLLINTYVDKYYDKHAENDFLGFFTRVIRKLADCERGSIFITDMGEETVWIEAGTEIERKEITVPRDSSMVGRVISSGKAEINNKMADKEGAHKDIDSSTGYSTNNAICVPVISLDGKKVTGAIQVLNKKKGGKFTRNDQKWLEEVAENIALNIEHAFLQQETLSMVDATFSVFTKLLNTLIIVTWVSIIGMTIASVFLYDILSS